MAHKTNVLLWGRGGGGVDSEWHKSGTGICKRNSILDFVSCGLYLINEGYICRDRLAAMSSSAGCLVVGAAINMYPQLLRAAILKVRLRYCHIPLTFHY